jgi:hypothetical protein
LIEVIAAKSLLPFQLDLIDGTSLRTVRDAAEYLATLSEDRRADSHWRVAIQMLNHAMKEPIYLKAAAMSLQSALLLDGNLLAHPD